MKVLVTGGTGYVGQPMVKRLLAHGHHVRVLQRPNGHRRLHAEAEMVEADLFDAPSLMRACQDIDVIVHLVGIIREQRRLGQTMQRIHVDATQNLLTAARRAGVAQFIHMSALGAQSDAASAYHQSKWDAEQLVRDDGIPYTIFQPSVIFGEGGPGPNFLAQLQHLIRSTPIVPMIGDGAFALQPVAMATVAAAFISALTNAQAVNQTYELGGPDVILYRDLLRQMAAASGRHLRTLSVPVPIMRVIVPVLQRVPTFPLTTDQLAMLLQGNVCSDTERAYHDLGLAAIPLDLFSFTI